MPYRQTTVSGFAAIALRNAEIEVVAVPSIGMKLTHLRRLRRGREWLWRSDQIPLSLPKAGASYVETADSGGWDECFPTVGPSPLPGAEPPVRLPDHGELWSAAWGASVLERGRETVLAASARGTLLPYEFTREAALDPDEPVLRLRYHLRHTGGAGSAAFPWIWSSHPLLNVQAGTTLDLPTMRQVRIDQVHGRPDLDADDTVAWPGAVGGTAERFTCPEMPEGAVGWAVKLFGDVGESGRMTVTDPRAGERLEIAVRPAEVPQVGIWINMRGWAPEGRTPYYNLALEPCIGAPDSLARAVEEWQTAQSLGPGEERSWELEVRLPDPEEA
jgi:galactose mutarotase-like enzyme